MDLILQGKGWLQDGEPPSAVLEETDEQLKAATQNQSKAAWKVVAAEALLMQGCIAEALELGAEALAQFKQLHLRDCEIAAYSVVIDALITKQDMGAVETASNAAAVCRQASDGKGEATMLLKLAEAHLATMQDPYAAAKSAISSCLLFRSVNDVQGDADALEVAARAHLLYDPEQSLQAAKEALTLCQQAGHFKAKARVEKTLAAAKAQIAISQQAAQAQSQSSRGDRAVQHKWPKVPQQRGLPVPDAFAVQARESEETGTRLALQKEGAQKVQTASASPVDKPGANFMRKAFKWTSGAHKTDEAWYRQELVYLPPPSREEVAS
mmetsp:Transcript_93360/g.166028  ORF Transcript_93360/g.166028 Transcript_93360/m.166028 type:complete len:325 (-) Transcript_93360:115-1089(-)|eukprot:CAMPEP_0197625868 /NCGR_PEP_ID=MMETSP1338-20131121/5106_1 /TAXON_ID=43686 ORGANISM="Pelagodinium beii, Strain RCC1491" /NCGR_SAMPLE_ID=MMETSP1338 /ASSEMBLY_ACC=CAM_ASM_000754 /LENGTH=324 /DNA_ID=CAMNT_0043196375 /DNA_START=48 /DNA_END=1022 /DNA_ORIENTATION=+